MQRDNDTSWLWLAPIIFLGLPAVVGLVGIAINAVR